MPNPQNIVKHKFKKGESGNPNGRPPGANRATIAKKVLAMWGMLPDNTYNKLKEIFPDIERRMTFEEIMTIVQANKAVAKQDTQAYTALMDSAHGKAVSNVKLEADSTINIQYINPYDPNNDPEEK